MTVVEIVIPSIRLKWKQKLHVGMLICTPQWTQSRFESSRDTLLSLDSGCQVSSSVRNVESAVLSENHPPCTCSFQGPWKVLSFRFRRSTWLVAGKKIRTYHEILEQPIFRQTPIWPNRDLQWQVGCLMRFWCLAMCGLSTTCHGLGIAMAPFGCFLILGCLKIGDHQVTMGFNTIAWSNDLDDLGVGPF